MNADTKKNPAYVVHVTVGFAAVLSTITLSKPASRSARLNSGPPARTTSCGCASTAAFSGNNAIVSCMKQDHNGLSDRCKKTLPPALIEFRCVPGSRLLSAGRAAIRQVRVCLPGELRSADDRGVSIKRTGC